MKIKYVAGVDVGNDTTEVALGKIVDNRLALCCSGIAKTSGLKGTTENIFGILNSLKGAAKRMRIDLNSIDLIRLNEATPVIGDFAMETITKTVITDSTMIGHDPDTPGGFGLGVGKSILLQNPFDGNKIEPYIPIVTSDWDFDKAAAYINSLTNQGFQINGLIVQKDDGTLLNNRLNRNIPIVDEVAFTEKIPLNCLCAVEVASAGKTIDSLSNPYGIASIFDLDAEETQHIAHIAKALIGSRSAVVIKTPMGNVCERIIPAGSLLLKNENRIYTVPVENGAEKIMQAVDKAAPLIDVSGTSGTNIGGMLENVREKMSVSTDIPINQISIQDIFAVDTLASQAIAGGIANEFAMEKSVGIAAMVKTEKLNMFRIAQSVSQRLNCQVEIGGVEGSMAMIGALTTPGTSPPIAIVDIGAGSTDACYQDKDHNQHVVHLAGAGKMVTALIASELGLSSSDEADAIKRYSLAKVESLFHIRYEDGTVQFFEQPLPSHLFGRIVTVRDNGFVPVNTRHSMEKVKEIRQSIKKNVLTANVLRALKRVSVTGNLHEFSHVVLVGGSSLDFEFSNIVTDVLSRYGITSGKGNIRATQGPRNAVATGLLYSYLKGVSIDV